MCSVQKRELSLYYFLSYVAFDAFLWIFMSALQLEYPLEYNHDTTQLCRTGHDDMSRTRTTALSFILFELFSLDCFRCNFVSAP